MRLAKDCSRRVWVSHTALSRRSAVRWISLRCDTSAHCTTLASDSPRLSDEGPLVRRVYCLTCRAAPAGTRNHDSDERQRFRLLVLLLFLSLLQFSPFFSPFSFFFFLEREKRSIVPYSHVRMHVPT